MRPTVYLETSVISYVASRPSRDLIVAAHQQLTHEWWEKMLPRCEAFVSAVVLGEIARGDPGAARRWLDRVTGLTELEITDEARELAEVYFPSLSSSDAMRRDAYHIALATVHGVNYLATWILSAHRWRRGPSDHWTDQ